MGQSGEGGGVVVVEGWRGSDGEMGGLNSINPSLGTAAAPNWVSSGPRPPPPKFRRRSWRSAV